MFYYIELFFLGISTWGRKLGRTIDQLKRSESSELLSGSGRRRRWSPNRKSCGDVPNEKVNFLLEILQTNAKKFSKFSLLKSSYF